MDIRTTNGDLEGRHRRVDFSCAASFDLLRFVDRLRFFDLLRLGSDRPSPASITFL
jgi:hypothetical protein